MRISRYVVACCVALVLTQCGDDRERAGTCEYEGTTYEAGDSFADSDGCNTCMCDEDGLVSCTTMACAVR